MGNLNILGVLVDGKGAIRMFGGLSAGADKAGRATEKFERTTKNLNRALITLGGAFGLRQLAEYADVWTLISARIGIVTNSTAQMMTVQQRLFDISQRTRNSLAATSVLYTRVALNADQLGRSHEELLIATESVNAALLLGGATGVEAAQSIRQLAQALGSGRLQGDEFRTVMEAMPVVARAISDEMGVAVGELKELSKDGLIDVQTVLDALINKNAEWVALIDTMPFTVGQAFLLMTNALTRVFGILNAAYGISQKFAEAMKVVAKNIDKVIASLGALIAALITYQALQLVATGLKAIQAWRKLNSTISTTAAIMNTLKSASKGIIGVLIVLASAAVGLVAYKLLLKEITEETQKWLDAQEKLTDAIGEGTGDAIDTDTADEIADMLRLANQAIVLASLTGKAQEDMEVRFDAVNKRVEARRDLEDANLVAMLKAIDAEEQLLFQVIAVEKAIEDQVKAFEDRAQIIERFLKNVQESFANTFTEILEDGIEKFSDLFDAIKRLFIRLVSEMASAKLIENIGPQLNRGLSGLFGVSEEDRARMDASNEARLRGLRSMEAAELGGTSSGETNVVITDVTVPAARSWARHIAPALGGFFAGQIIGSQAGSVGAGTLQGAAGGAATGFAVGGPAGALVGGLTGALGGFMGASEAQRLEAERLRLQLEANATILAQNNLHLAEIKGAFEGDPNTNLLAALATNTIQNQLNPPPGRTAVPRNLNVLSPEERALIISAAQQVGIQLLDDEGKIIAGALAQLTEAIEFSIKALTSFGNNLSDARSQQNARNILFDVEETPEQKLKDTADLLKQLAPDLLAQLGIADADLSTQEGRDVFEEGMREIFRMVLSGDFTDDPALLGAFASKDELIDAILRAKNALDDFQAVLFDVTTDFPRAMNIPFWEQLFGSFGTEQGTRRDRAEDLRVIPSDNRVDSDNHRNRRGFADTAPAPLAIGTVQIINDAGDDGEVLLTKIEDAANRRRARGGSIDLDRTGESLF